MFFFFFLQLCDENNVDLYAVAHFSLYIIPLQLIAW